MTLSCIGNLSRVSTTKKHDDDGLCVGEVVAAAERDARAAGRGLWADKAPVAPWAWRAGEKDRKGQPAMR